MYNCFDHCFKILSDAESTLSEQNILDETHRNACNHGVMVNGSSFRILLNAKFEICVVEDIRLGDLVQNSGMNSRKLHYKLWIGRAEAHEEKYLCFW